MDVCCVLCLCLSCVSVCFSRVFVGLWVYLVCLCCVVFTLLCAAFRFVCFFRVSCLFAGFFLCVLYVFAFSSLRRVLRCVVCGVRCVVFWCGVPCVLWRVVLGGCGGRFCFRGPALCCVLGFGLFVGGAGKLVYCQAGFIPVGAAGWLPGTCAFSVAEYNPQPAVDAPMMVAKSPFLKCLPRPGS